MNSKDWAKIYTPLITELAKAILGLIFGDKNKKAEIVKKFGGGGYNEGTNDYDVDYHNSSGSGVRW